MIYHYLTERPPKHSDDYCATCYKSKRYVFVFENKTRTPIWHSDLTANSTCDDLEGLIVNASVALTDYVSDGQQEYFDLAEFFGTQYRIQRVTIDSDKKVLALKELKTDSIGTLFGCIQPTISTSTTTTTESPKPTEGSERRVVTVFLVSVIFWFNLIFWVGYIIRRQRKRRLNYEREEIQLRELGPPELVNAEDEQTRL